MNVLYNTDIMSKIIMFLEKTDIITLSIVSKSINNIFKSEKIWASIWYTFYSLNIICNDLTYETNVKRLWIVEMLVKKTKIFGNVFTLKRSPTNTTIIPIFSKCIVDYYGMSNFFYKFNIKTFDHEIINDICTLHDNDDKLCKCLSNFVSSMCTLPVCGDVVIDIENILGSPYYYNGDFVIPCIYQFDKIGVPNLGIMCPDVPLQYWYYKTSKKYDNYKIRCVSFPIKFIYYININIKYSTPPIFYNKPIRWSYITINGEIVYVFPFKTNGDFLNKISTIINNNDESFLVRVHPPKYPVNVCYL